MINIKDFPEGTKLSIVFSAPITDYYDDKLPEVYCAVNKFEIPTNLLSGTISSNLNFQNIFFIEKIDFSEVEVLSLVFATSEKPSLTSEDLTLNLPSIKYLSFNSIFQKLSKVTLNCGDNFTQLIDYPYSTTSNNEYFTLTINSNSNNIKKIQLSCDKYAKEIHANFNCENLTTAPYTSAYSKVNYLLFHSGFPNVKYSKNDNYYYYNFPNLTRESYLSIFNNLYDFTGNNETPTSSQGKLKFNSNIANVCTQEDINIAINKGWTITY